ncbi:uncharacterized protein LOC103479932 [Poecilia reticulata]|uniref:uncharacterized protein LOC103479932 n=1 Tax=Poecilia reticulata TaxID=8081 RepID=UPI0007E9B0CA|nr:PREDICTED: uncharacterized protein LOC103479932 [Poecilia reticulata]
MNLIVTGSVEMSWSSAFRNLGLFSVSVLLLETLDWIRPVELFGSRSRVSCQFCHCWMETTLDLTGPSGLRIIRKLDNLLQEVIIDLVFFSFSVLNGDGNHRLINTVRNAFPTLRELTGGAAQRLPRAYKLLPIAARFLYRPTQFLYRPTQFLYRPTQFLYRPTQFLYRTEHLPPRTEYLPPRTEHLPPRTDQLPPRVLRLWRNGIRFPLGTGPLSFLNVFVKPVDLTSEHIQFNVGLSVSVLPFPLTLGSVGRDINLVNRPFGLFQARVDFARLSFEDGEIRVYFPVTIRFQRD